MYTTCNFNTTYSFFQFFENTILNLIGNLKKQKKDKKNSGSFFGSGSLLLEVGYVSESLKIAGSSQKAKIAAAPLSSLW